MPATARASSLTSPTLRTPSAPSAAAAAAHGELLLARRRVRARAACARPAAPAMRAGISSSGALQLRRRGLGAARSCALRVLARRRAGERLDAAHAGRDARCRRRPRSGRCRRCAATWVPPHSSTDQPSALPPPLAHRDDAHLVAVFLAEQRARAGRARIVERHQPRRHRRVLQHDVVGDVLDAARAPRRVIGFGCEKSKRSRSGATSEPFCAT